MSDEDAGMTAETVEELLGDLAEYFDEIEESGEELASSEKVLRDRIKEILAGGGLIEIILPNDL